MEKCNKKKELLLGFVLSVTALGSAGCELYRPSDQNISQEVSAELQTILSDAGHLVAGYQSEISMDGGTSVEVLDANVKELKLELEEARGEAMVESVKVRIHALEDHIDQAHGEFRDLLIKDNPALNEEKSIEAFWAEIQEKITEIQADK